MPAPLFNSPITLPQPPFAVEASDSSETAPRGIFSRRKMRASPAIQRSRYELVRAAIEEVAAE